MTTIASLSFSGTCAFAALIDVPSGTSIGSAIAKAVAGDMIRLAPGTYNESVTVGKRGLTITSATTPGSEPDVVITSANSFVLKDGQDTVWRGVTFTSSNPETLLANLTGFSGRMEYCRVRFDEKKPGKQCAVISASATIHGTTFANQESNAEALRILPGSDVLFSYCRFENLKGGAVDTSAKRLRLLNCLFVRNSHLINRYEKENANEKERIHTDVEITNSIFFLNTTPNLFRGALEPQIRAENCVFTPGRAPFRMLVPLARSLEEEKALALQNCSTQSPRFLTPRRKGILSLGIDDTRCISLWSTIAQEANQYKYPLTIAVNAFALQNWHVELLGARYKEGHEIASHGMSHLPLNSSGGIEVGYPNMRAKSAYLTLKNDNVLRVYINDKLEKAISLGTSSADMRSLQRVVEQLHRLGFNARLSDSFYRDVPAVLLMKTDRLDTLFASFMPTLGLSPTNLTKYETSVSHHLLNKKLAPWGAKVNVIVYPFTAFSGEIERESKKAGFIAARAGGNFQGFDPYTAGIEPMRIYGTSLTYSFPPETTTAQTAKQGAQMLIDYLNDTGAVVGVYSHEQNEFTFENWKVLLKTLHDDGFVGVLSLQGILKTLKKYGTLRDGRYFFPTPPDAGDYHLRADSPLRAAGKPTGLTHDFEGKPLPQGKPSIGLYQ